MPALRSPLTTVSRAVQTVSSSCGSEAVYHGHHLHRPLFVLVMVAPLITLLNGVVVFLYWKPKVVTQARLDDPSNFEPAVRVEPAYYCYVMATFLHFVLTHVFVVQRGIRTLIGQRTSQVRDAEAQTVMATFVGITTVLFASHYVLYERLRVFTPTASSNLSTDALEQEKASVGLVRLVLWGTLIVCIVVAWYWWTLHWIERLQRGVRLVADREAAERREKQRQWHQALGAPSAQPASEGMDR